LLGLVNQIYLKEMYQREYNAQSDFQDVIVGEYALHSGRHSISIFSSNICMCHFCPEEDITTTTTNVLISDFVSKKGKSFL
jgi:hypothetical protein